MSYNLVDPTTGDLTLVAGRNTIDNGSVSNSKVWSSKKVSDELEKKQDFRIFNSLEEFNEKKGTSLTVVSGVDNMKDIANAMSNGEILIIITKCELGSEVYFGLTTSTGWTKMFTFVKSNGLCDVECRTTFPLTLKRVLNSDGVIGDWQELATMDKVNALHEATTGYITGSLLGSVVKNANLYYQKFGDSRLVINGWVSIDAVSTRTPIFTLPNDWKVNSNYLLPCYVDNSNVACACVIDIETGTVKSYTPLPATLELRFCGEIYLI